MDIAANATAQPVHKGFAVTSTQAKLIYISSHRLYRQNRLPKSIYLEIPQLLMIPYLIFELICSRVGDMFYSVKVKSW